MWFSLFWITILKCLFKSFYALEIWNVSWFPLWRTSICSTLHLEVHCRVMVSGFVVMTSKVSGKDCTKKLINWKFFKELRVVLLKNTYYLKTVVVSQNGIKTPTLRKHRNDSCMNWFSDWNVFGEKLSKLSKRIPSQKKFLQHNNAHVHLKCSSVATKQVLVFIHSFK